MRDRALPVGLGEVEQGARFFGLGHPRRPVEDEGRGDVGLVHQQLRLQQFELEADRPQILAEQELIVLEREFIRSAFGLRGGGNMLGGGGIDLRVGEDPFGRFWIGHTRRGLAGFAE